jgi:acyl-coenzyme A thioesterase PaaI-like protein
MDVIENLSVLTTQLIMKQQTPPKGFLPRLKRSGSYLTLNKLISFAIPFAGRAGFEITELKPGLLRAKIPHKGNTNHLGTMYAGALFTLAEIPGGIMAIFEFGAGYFPILKEMNITFQAPAKSDVTVEFKIPKRQIRQILAETDKEGKSDFILHGRLFDEGGELVAETTGNYQLRVRKQNQ